MPRGRPKKQRAKPVDRKPSDREVLRRVAFHVAGKAVFAMVLDLDVEQATIVSIGDRPGYVQIKRPADMKPHQAGRREIMASLAGYVAEWIYLGGDFDPFKDNAFVAVSRGRSPGSRTEPTGLNKQVERRLMEHVVDRIPDHWDHIWLVADKLQKQSTISGAQVWNLKTAAKRRQLRRFLKKHK
jgi:hypothetical protein